MTYVRTCKWTLRGVTSWEHASTWTLLPHPTPPLRDGTHLQRSMTYACKWTCRGVTSWECASTWTLLPHPTPPQGTYIKMPKTLGRFSTRRLKQGLGWGESEQRWLREEVNQSFCRHFAIQSCSQSFLQSFNQILCFLSHDSLVSKLPPWSGRELSGNYVHVTVYTYHVWT